MLFVRHEDMLFVRYEDMLFVRHENILPGPEYLSLKEIRSHVNCARHEDAIVFFLILKDKTGNLNIL